LVKYLIHNMQRGLARGLAVMAERGEIDADADCDAIAQSMTAAFWSAHMLLSKGELALTALEPTINRLFISLIMPVSRGKARKHLEALYRDL